MYFSDCFGLSQKCLNEVEKARSKFQNAPRGERKRESRDRRTVTQSRQEGRAGQGGWREEREKHRNTEKRGWVVICREKEADAEGRLKRVDAGNLLPLTRRMMCRISSGGTSFSRIRG